MLPQLRCEPRSLHMRSLHVRSLVISRGADGGWQMENEWVVMTADLAVDGPYAQGIDGRAPHLA